MWLKNIQIDLICRQLTLLWNDRESTVHGTTEISVICRHSTVHVRIWNFLQRSENRTFVLVFVLLNETCWSCYLSRFCFNGPIFKRWKASRENNNFLKQHINPKKKTSFGTISRLNDSAVISKQECNLFKLGQVFSGENNIRVENGIRVVFMLLRITLFDWKSKNYQVY